MQCRIFHIFAIIVIMATAGYPQSEWIYFGNSGDKKTNISLIQSDNQHVVFSVKFSAMQVGIKDMNNESYHQLTIPDCEQKTTPGLPAVPVFKQLIAVPDCDQLNIKITKADSLIIENYDIIPAPEYIVENDLYQENYSECDDIYSMNAYFPDKCGRIIESGKIRNQSVIRVEIYPIRFNPVTRELKICSNLEIGLEFTNPKSELIRNVGPFYKACKGAILNYE